MSNEERKKYYRFTIEFETEEERDSFKNYVHHVKMSKRISIPKIVLDMMYLHKLTTGRKSKWIG